MTVTQGTYYTAEKDDTFESISILAYGTSAKAFLIKSANDPYIFTGQQIFIPKDTLVQALESNIELKRNAGRDVMTLLIDGKEIQISNGKLARSMDSVLDAWSATIPADVISEPELYNSIVPFKESKVYLGDTLMGSGLVYITSQDSDSSAKTIICNSRNANMVDSVLQPPYEKNKVSLKNRISELSKIHGVLADYRLDSDEIFDRVTAGKLDTVFMHLAKLVKQRGGVMYPSRDGGLIITKADTSGPIVASLIEGQPPALRFASTFNGRKRFSSYRATGQTPGYVALEGFAKDTNVPSTRFTTFTANDATKGNIQKAAEWARSKSVADSLTFPIPVDSWYHKDGLWEENTMVNVQASSLHLQDGRKMVIRSVEYNFSIGEPPAILHVCPPEAFTGEEIRDFWI